jgi:hypothetical protein
VVAISFPFGTELASPFGLTNTCVIGVFFGVLNTFNTLRCRWSNAELTFVVTRSIILATVAAEPVGMTGASVICVIEDTVLSTSEAVVVVWSGACLTSKIAFSLVN